MTRRTHPIDRLLSYACPVLLATCAPTRPPDRSSVVSPEPTDAVVKQVDHVMIATNERDRLEALLSDTLGLPVAWPAPGSARSSNTLVGLALGDVILELAPRRRTSPNRAWQFRVSTDRPPNSAGPSRQEGSCSSCAGYRAERRGRKTLDDHRLPPWVSGDRVRALTV